MKKNFLKLKPKDKKSIKNSQNYKMQYLSDKAKNNNSIRVLYKKTGQVPEIKIIDNVYKLKKAIIKNNLAIIPYEKIYIICNKKDYSENSNIIMPFYSVYGDLILTKINKKTREFESLSQDDIIWYSQDLINKSSYNYSNNIKGFKKIHNNNFKNIKEFYERDFTNTTEKSSFEKTLIDVLVNIELVLATILKNGDGKNE